jgi:HPt (histidine-containing phosphotransfer) domain-containing protein
MSNSTADILNLSTLDELHAVLEDALLEIVHAFLDGLDAEVHAIVQACDEQNADGIRRAAHSLKGSSANMGATALSVLSGQMEKLAANQAIAECQQRLTGLATVTEQTKQALAGYLQAKVG